MDRINNKLKILPEFPEEINLCSLKSSMLVIYTYHTVTLFHRDINDNKKNNSQGRRKLKNNNNNRKITHTVKYTVKKRKTKKKQ